MRTIGFSVCTIALMVSVSGCMTGPHIIENPDPWSNLEPGTPEWWASKAAISPGVKLVGFTLWETVDRTWKYGVLSTNYWK